MNEPSQVVTKRRMTRSRGLFLAAAIIILGVFGVVGYWWWSKDRGPRLRSESSVTASSEPGAPPELVLLKPGTVVESQAPEGWSHLVIKSITHLESGDLNTLPAFARKTAAQFRTAILADVGRDEGGSYRLRRVGAGLCLEINGHDSVISSETAKSQGVKLGVVDAMVLTRAEATLGRSHLAARTPTFALYDNFVELADRKGVHHSIILRYALTVDPTTGALRSAYWTMDEDAARRGAPGALAILPPACLFKCGIHVAAKRVVGVAASWGFAMTKLPPGESVPTPETLRKLGDRDMFDDPSALEQAVRAAMDSHADDKLQLPGGH